MEKKIAVFFDRDGVINQEPPRYAHRIDQLFFYDSVAKSIKIINDLGLFVIIVTNQSGIARGYYTEQDLEIFHREIERRLNCEGARIDAFYYCPHLPDATISAYKKSCVCRKPEPGMLLEAAKQFKIDLNKSYLVGDKISDLVAGRSVGCITILVKTGQGKYECEKIKDEADYITTDMSHAVDIIYKREKL